MSLTPNTTMRGVLEYYPGAALALFQRFRVGSQEKYGFGMDETLEGVLRRHLVFDAQQALDYLKTCKEQEEAWSRSPDSFQGWRLIDVRGRDLHEALSPPEAELLDAQVAGTLDVEERVLFFCQDGSQSAAAVRLFRARGLKEAYLLRGGLNGWARDRDFPLLAPQPEPPDHWCVLPAHEVVRRGVKGPAGPIIVYSSTERPGGRVGMLLDQDWVSAVALGPTHLTLYARSADDWPGRCRWFDQLLSADIAWVERAGSPRPQDLIETELKSLLRDRVSDTLKNHRGTVELAYYRDGVVGLEMGGGCQGCSSAEITVQHEMAALLQRNVPEIVRLVDVTDHQVTPQTYLGPEAPPRLS